MNGFDGSYFIEGGSETPMARSREAKKKTNRSGYRQLNAIRFKR